MKQGPKDGRLVGRLGDRSSDEKSPAVTASANVQVNNRRALRVGDTGQSGWRAMRGARYVLVNDRLLHRITDAHSKSELVSGSGNTIAGDEGEPGNKPPGLELLTIVLKNQNDDPIPEMDFTLSFEGAVTRKGKTDKKGEAKEKMKPGTYEVDFPDLAKKDWYPDGKAREEDPKREATTGEVNKFYKRLIVVIDPGHGEGSKNYGASTITGYKTKNKQGKTVITSVDQLGGKAGTGSVVQDSHKTEAGLVLKISKVMAEELRDNPHVSVYETRTTDSIDTTGYGNKKDIAARKGLVTAKKPEYFASIHADGAEDYRASGAHSIYNVARDKPYAEDIMSYYTVVKQRAHNNPDQRSNLGVLSSKYAADTRKTLVEVGFVSNPSEYAVMNASSTTAGKQLAAGLLSNARKNFKLVPAQDAAP